MKKIRLGIIGLGAEGGLYADLLTKGAVSNMELAAICDIDPAKKKVAEEKYPEVPFFDDYMSVLESGKVDAIVTTVPHYFHCTMAIDAIERGIHVLGEKPAGVYTKDVKRMNACAAAHPEVTFGIMFNQRMNPLYQKIKEIVDNGEIGAIRRTNWIITTWWRPQGYYNQSAWRATWGGEGGGVLVNQAPHQLDLWQWICGVPKSVFAKCAYGYKRDIVVEDEVNCIVDYGNGATGSFVTCTHDIAGTDRFEILGDQGKIVVEGSKKAIVTRLRKPEMELSSTMDMSDVGKIFMGLVDTAEYWTTEEIEFPNEGMGMQHARVMENFAAHILDGTPLLAPGADGINGVRLANAIHLSSWKKEEVSLDFDEDEYLRLLNERIVSEGKYEVKQ